jgi:hypothetical protein
VTAYRQCVVVEMRDMDRVYKTVNDAWGAPSRELPPVTFGEARTATKRLWRKFVGRTFPYTVKETSGNRHTWVKRGRVYSINARRGWWDVVHSVAHLAHHRLHPNDRSHAGTQAYLERRMIEHVVSSGWLEGKLKRPTKPKAPRDIKAVRHARAVANLKRWKTKQRRADTAIKKLVRTVRYYEKQAA